MTRRLRSLWMMLLCAAAVGVSAQSDFVHDSFTGTNGTTLQAHAPNTGAAWTRVVGNNLDIQTNTLRATAVNAGDIYTNGTAAPSANYIVGMTVTFTNANANNYINVIGRGNVTAQSGYLAQFQANGAVIVWPVVAGVVGTAIINTTTAVTLNAPHIFQLEMVGNQISALVDSTQFGPVTNGAVSVAGVVGLGLNANNITQVIADEFYASTFAVTDVKMRSMLARQHGGKALVEWATGREVSNLGFRVWRQEGSRRTVITPSLVAGSAFLTNATLTAGNRYRWVDDDASPRSRYWIESIGVNGRSEWSGPIVPVFAPFDAPIATPLLRDLSQRIAPAVATRTRPAIAANGARRVVAPPDTLSKQLQLAAEPAVKISVDADGWYRVTRAELLAAGLDPASDPQRLHLYTDGVEVASSVEVGEQGVGVEAVRFYGTALDTPSTATHVYWLVAEDGPARRIQTVTATGNGATPVSFLVSAERRDKAIFFGALANGDQESFFGPLITNDTTKPALQTLRLAHIDHSASTAELEITLQGASDFGSDSQHAVGVTLNGQPLDDILFSGRDATYVHRVLPLGRFVDGDNTLAFTAKNGDGDLSLVASVRVTYARTYDFDGSPFVLTAGGATSVAVPGVMSAAMYALDVTAPEAPVELPVTVSDGVARFVTPPGIGRGIIVTTDFAHAARVEANTPSSLHATAGADMIIIAHPSLLSAVEPLRQLRTAQGLSVLVASTDDVYDEYGFGAKDPAAVRAFLAATRNWKSVPRYVLLIGDATWDPRNYLGYGDFDLVPTKLIVTTEMKTASDSWLTDFDDDGVANMAIGRLPVRTLADAQLEVGKIVAYENVASGLPWMRSALLVSDADDALDFEGLSQSVRDLVPAGYTTDTIDVAASGTTAARGSLLNALDSGALFVNFVGHGSVGVWTDSGLFAADDAKTLSNSDRLPFVVAMTCLNGYFHDVYIESLAETLLAAPHGGAVAVWASSSLTDANAQATADQELVRSLFSTHATIGEAALAAQAKATNPDVRRTFLLFGDPAMHLKQ